MERKSGLKLTVLLLMAGFCAPPAALAERVRVPGTEVSLEPPAGFSPAERFPGFQLEERGASIMVTEIPGPVTEVRKGMTRRGLASRGMTLTESRTVKLPAGNALLLHVTQRAAGMDYAKWMLVAGTSEKTVLVVGTFPEESADLSQPVRRAVLSASWSGKENADLFEGLAFRVTPSGELRLAKRVGNVLVLSETGEIDPGEPGQAILAVGGSLSDVDVGSLKDFSMDRAARTDHFTRLRNVSGRELKIDSLPGYELVAEANDVKTDKPVGLYQVILVDGRTYYLAQGFVESGRARDLLPVFRGVTSTFRRVEDRPGEGRQEK